MNAMTIEQRMAILQALDPKAHVAFSTYTGKWYMSAGLYVGDGTMLRGFGEHCDTADAAIVAYFNEATNLDLDHYLASEYHDHRREWRWNGAAFAECTRDSVFTQELARATERSNA